MATQERLHALDAVRAFALLSGIALHATMSFFLPIPARDVSQSATLNVVFFLIHTWRMTTFFLVAGLFARLVMTRRGARGFMADRARRILVPLLVGWIILAPLTIAALIWGVGRSADAATVAAVNHPAAVPQGAFPLVHLWFLYYLCIFYVLLLAVRGAFLKLDPGGVVAAALDRGLRMLLNGHFAPLVFAAPIFVVLGFDQRIAVLGGIPTPDSSLIPQLPALVGFGTAFGIGWLLHRQLELLSALRSRWMGQLAIGIALSIACQIVPGIRLGSHATPLGYHIADSTPFYAACYLVSAWYWTFGIIGAALRFCAKESAIRRYLADSSYYLYLGHLPIVFFLAAAFAKIPLHWALKFPLILAITMVVLLLSYHYLVRPTWIGEILNGRKYPRARGRSQAPSAPVVTGSVAAPEHAQPVAELVQARKSYGTQLALDGVGIEVRPGEVLAVLGPNGAGKSTAISLWLGLLQADDGQVRLMGRSPLEVASRREIGVMMQEVALEPLLSVRELVDLAGSYYPHPLSVREALELTGTAGLANRRYAKLSAGQKRQAQFAMAVVGQPKLLFLDEPTVGLDVQARETMWAAIRCLIASGCSIVLTTHYLEEAEALADRVIVLAKGRVIASGSVAEVRSVVSRTHIRCASTLTAENVRQWPGVMDASQDAQKLTITAVDAESVVRRLLAADATVSQLEVRPAALADAFTVLTQEAA
ncbi:MAG TPA: ATP-binding cassette domain-containing protein [Steroidobacteraceae bacterium]|nr:ATP-binding cassette domain-containing protein [Steroidobacteraceae bacterium]